MRVIQGKNVFMVYVAVSVKNQMIGVFVKMIVCGILKRVIVNVIRHVQLMNSYILKIAYGKKLHWNITTEDQISNVTKTSFNDKTLTFSNNCLVQTIVLIILYTLFLAVISILLLLLLNKTLEKTITFITISHHKQQTEVKFTLIT